LSLPHDIQIIGAFSGFVANDFLMKTPTNTGKNHPRMSGTVLHIGLLFHFSHKMILSISH
jgi:hypothetical protein